MESFVVNKNNRYYCAEALRQITGICDGLFVKQLGGFLIYRQNFSPASKINEIASRHLERRRTYPTMSRKVLAAYCYFQVASESPSRGTSEFPVSISGQQPFTALKREMNLRHC